MVKTNTLATLALILLTTAPAVECQWSNYFGTGLATLEHRAALHQHVVAQFADLSDRFGQKAARAAEQAIVDAANKAGEDAHAKAKAGGKTDDQADAEAKAATAAFYDELNLSPSYFETREVNSRNRRRFRGFNAIFPRLYFYLAFNQRRCDIKAYKVFLRPGERVPKELVKEGCENCPASPSSPILRKASTPSLPGVHKT